jgi:hypothetical protein
MKLIPLTAVLLAPLAALHHSDILVPSTMWIDDVRISKVK